MACPNNRVGFGCEGTCMDLFGFARTCLIALSMMMMGRLFTMTRSCVWFYSVAHLSPFLAGIFILPRLIDRLFFWGNIRILPMLSEEPNQKNMLQALTACSLWILSAMLVFVFYSTSGLPELPVIDLMFIFLGVQFGARHYRNSGGS